MPSGHGSAPVLRAPALALSLTVRPVASLVSENATPRRPRRFAASLRRLSERAALLRHILLIVKANQHLRTARPRSTVPACLAWRSQKQTIGWAAANFRAGVDSLCCKSTKEWVAVCR